MQVSAPNKPRHRVPGPRWSDTELPNIVVKAECQSECMSDLTDVSEPLKIDLFGSKQTCKQGSQAIGDPARVRKRATSAGMRFQVLIHLLDSHRV